MNKERLAVPEDPIERFMGIIFSMTEQFGIDEIPDAMHYLELMSQAIDRYVFEQGHKVSPHRKITAERKKFIVIFKKRYLHLTDYEYSRVITGIDCKLINQLSKKLTDNGFDIDDFLKWMFDIFLVDSPKFCPPSIKWTCGNFIVEKFLYEHKDKMKEKTEDEIREKEAVDVVGRARVLIRMMKERGDLVTQEKIVERLKTYREKGIIGELREFILELEKIEQNRAGDKGGENGGNTGNEGGNGPDQTNEQHPSDAR